MATERRLAIVAVLAAVLALGGGLGRAAGDPWNAPEQRDARRFYEERQFRPVWIDEFGRPTDDARAALALLRDAASEGLDPGDYESYPLDCKATSLGMVPQPLSSDIAAFDVQLTQGLLRYFRHLHLGRVDPRSVGFHMDPEPERHDFVRLLQTALSEHRIPEAAASLEPPLAQYRLLRGALMRLRLDPVRSHLWASHVRGIELALERLRWLPDLPAGRVLVVNIPTFTLLGWDRGSDAPALSARVIVGRSVGLETPVLVSDVRQIVFRPYWNVPASILRNDILPAMARNPAYLARENMEIVDRLGEVVPATAAALARLRAGELRLRQRPGPANALGLVKFVFPNEFGVYMHSTPAPALFDRARRDFSHGCIRVDEAAGLAEWMLHDQPGWSRESVLEAMEGPTRTVELASPVRLIVFYTTAVVDPATGDVRFAADIYGHDQALERALQLKAGDR